MIFNQYGRCAMLCVEGAQLSGGRRKVEKTLNPGKRSMVLSAWAGGGWTGGSF